MGAGLWFVFQSGCYIGEQRHSQNQCPNGPDDSRAIQDAAIVHGPLHAKLS